MSYVLVDNSTLTSVQRLLGEISINNKNIIEGDILATENLIQSILFYDNIIAIDDYIEKHKEERIKRFNFIKFLSPKEFEFENLRSEAQVEAKRYQPEIRGGEFVDEVFKSLLESLNLNIITTWDIASSEYYLNLKLLGYSYDREFSKYNQIASSIFGDMDNSEKADYRCQLFDRGGSKIQKGYQVPNAKWGNFGQTGEKLLRPQLWRFIASLNWIAYKSIYYTHVARYLKSDLYLHPIRQNFNIHYANKIMEFDDRLIAKLLESLKSESMDTIKVIKKSMQPSLQEFEIPYFTFYLVNQTRNSKHIIEKAYDIRSRQCFIDAREQLAELNNLIYEEDDLKKFSISSQKIKSNLFQTMNKIKSDYGLATEQGLHLNKLIKIANSTFSINIPDIFDNYKVSLPEFIQAKPKGLNLVYRDITEDLAKVARFGQYYDLLTSNVDLVPNDDYDRRYDFEFKCEDPRFRFSSSDFKSPM